MKKYLFALFFLPSAVFAQYYIDNGQALMGSFHAGYQAGSFFGGSQGAAAHQAVLEIGLYVRSLKFKAFWFMALGGSIPLKPSFYNTYTLSISLGVGGYLSDWRTSGSYGSTLIMHGALRLPFNLNTYNLGRSNNSGGNILSVIPINLTGLGTDIGPEIGLRYQYHRGSRVGFSLGLDLGFSYYSSFDEKLYGMRLRLMIGAIF